jgi:sugar/nucleoside kinase (ribokinase family)
MICVVGALAVDMLVRRGRFVRGTSNPAPIALEPGGVGYRIFANLPEPKRLYTALGADLFGRWLAEQISDGQQLQPIFLDRYRTACYCAFMESGKLLYGASDMAVIQEGLTWPQLRARVPELGPADMLVLEANLSPGLVRTLIRRFGRKTRVVFEGVSVEKLLRHQQGLSDLFMLSANEEELRALGRALALAVPAGHAAGHSRGDAAPGDGGAAGPAPGGAPPRGDGWVGRFMRERRISHLLVSRGTRGVRLYAVDAEGQLRRREQEPRQIVESPDTTGAGDRLLAAVLEQADSLSDLADSLPAAVAAVGRLLKERARWKPSAP